jgi:hypothetical protein
MKTSLAVVLIALSTLAWSQGPNQEKREPRRADDAATTDQRGSEKTPFVVKVLPAPDADKKAAEDKKDREDKANSDAWLVRFTGILAAIGVLQVFVYGFQSWKLSQTLRAAQIVERGRVFARIPGDGLVVKLATEPMGVKYCFGNYGNTPVIIREIAITSAVVQKGALPPRSGFTPFEVFEPVAPKSSNETRPCPVPEPWPPGGAFRGYILGEVKYDDMFGDTHTLRFCYKAIRRKGDPNILDYVARGNEEYNGETSERTKKRA